MPTRVWTRAAAVGSRRLTAWAMVRPCGAQLRPLGTTAANRPIVPAPDDYDDGEIGGMMIGRGNRSTQRRPAPVPLCPPQTPHAARTRTRTAAVGSERLTAWATVLPNLEWLVLSLRTVGPGFETGSRYRLPWLRPFFLKKPLHILLKFTVQLCHIAEHM
jgi:hypothetical protein